MITRILIGLNILAFLWEVRAGGSGMLNIGLTSGGGNADFSRIDMYTLAPVDVRVHHEYYRIITSAFLHASLSHIAVNMFSLWVLGRFIELVLGPVRTVLTYAVAIAASGAAVILFSDPVTPTLGASGAIYGLFGALFGIGLKLGPRGGDLIRSNLGILVLNLLFSFYFPGISWQAHIGGLIAGFITAYLLYFPPQPVVAHVIDPQSGAHYTSIVENPGDEQQRY